MSEFNNCKNCGGPNSHFATSCSFCKSPIKADDLGSISNTELVGVINLWIGRYIADGANAYEHNGMIQDYSEEDLNGIISQYLSILQMRAVEDASIRYFYNDLVTKFAAKKNEKRKEMTWGWVVLVAVIAAMVFGIYLMRAVQIMKYVPELVKHL